MKTALFYKPLKDKAVLCQACRHHCRILEGKTGVCGVRLNKSGKLYLTVYNRPVAVNIDPIEKKPLYHFLPGTTIFSLGTWGCNFACDFCQNWDISQAPKEIKAGRSDRTLDDLIRVCDSWPPEKIVKYCLEKQIPSIAYTYNEPAIFIEYAFDTAKLAHKKKIKNVFVSNGFESKETLDLVEPYLDAINIDLKSIRPAFYQKICHAKLEPVLENIKRIARSKIWLELTTLIIPDFNDSDEELAEIAQFIAELDKNIPWHLSAFYPCYKMADVSPTPLKTLERAYKIGKKAGLNFVYLGNVANEHQKTICPKCQKILVERNYLAVRSHVIRSKCPSCRIKIAGAW